MRNVILLIVIATLSMAGCAMMRAINDKGSIDLALVGTWDGSHTKKDGTIRSWKQIRHKNGGYEIFFGVDPVDGGKYEFTEAGRWWIAGGLFHEATKKNNKSPYVYKYEFYESNCLKFSQVSRDLYSDEYDGYTFTECRRID